MSFTDQKPRIATEQDVTASWGGAKNGKYFRCYLCGHKFVIGDQYRFVFGKDTVNCIVCQLCDGTDEEVRGKWRKLQDEFDELSSGKFWFFTKRIENNYEDELREVAREERELVEDREYWKGKAQYGGEERNYG